MSIGHLADRIAGAGTLRNPPPDSDPLSRDQVRAIQASLNDRGFDAGTPDGVPGSATRRAVRAFQVSIDVTADGFADAELLAQLGIE